MEQPDVLESSSSALFAETVRAYAGFSSFEQRGSARSVVTFDDGSPPQVRETSFHIVFARADRMRFEFEQRDAPSSKGTLWAHDGEARTFFLGHTVTTLSIAGAIQFFAGVSQLASVVVPSLLLGCRDEHCGSGLLERTHLVREEAVEGSPCLVFVSTMRDGSFQVWLDRASHLLRRTEVRSYSSGVAQVPDEVDLAGLSPEEGAAFIRRVEEMNAAPHPFSTQTTTTYSPPTVNTPIDSSRFEFTPPEEPAAK